MGKWFRLAVIVIGLTMLTGCLTEKNPVKAREAFAAKNPGKITFGIVGALSSMRDNTDFLKGVTLAVAEVNAQNSGAFVLTIRVEDDKTNFMEGIRIAQSLAAQPEITAVIGPWSSSVALPAARIYNDAGLIMLSPVASSPELTNKGYGYVFRNILSDSATGRQLARHATRMNYRRVVIFYGDNEFGLGLANAFEDAFSQAGRKVVDRVTDFNNGVEFDQTLEKWRALNYDAILVADSGAHAIEFIRQMRERDRKIPMFGGQDLDRDNFLAGLGAAAEGFVVASLFNPKEGRPQLRQFIAKYRKQYAEAPDVWAAQGYECVKLLTYAVHKAGGASPRKIAAVLHGLKGWPGVLGTVSFDATGELKRERIFTKVVRAGKFEFLPSLYD